MTFVLKGTQGFENSKNKGGKNSGRISSRLDFGKNNPFGIAGRELAKSRASTAFENKYPKLSGPFC